MPKPIGSTFSRRAVAVGIAVSPLTLSGSASAQQPAPTPAAPPRVKGPRVWLDLDQKELDDAYDQSVYAPNIRTVLQRTARNSELVRDRIGAPKRFSYGPTEIEALDVFTRQDAERAGARVHPRRRLARRPRQGLPLSGRDVRQCRREFRRARFHQCHAERRRPARHGRSGATLGGLGLQECQELRRRSRPLLHQRPFVRRHIWPACC